MSQFALHDDVSAKLNKCNDSYTHGLDGNLLMRSNITNAVFATNILLSAFLIFFIQPVCAKFLLPHWGGSAFVWIASVLFFQTSLFLGYLYAFYLAKLHDVRWQVIAHVLILLSSFYFIPVALDQSATVDTWLPAQVMLVLSSGVLLPMMLVSATSPLLQHWFVHLTHSEYPYGFYAVSNAGSLIGLFSYPLLLELWLALDVQFTIWSWLYAGFGLVTLVVCTMVYRKTNHNIKPVEVSPVKLTQWGKWILLACLGSALMLATTYYITQNLINMPLIWVIPLSLYLISFIVTFAKNAHYDRQFWPMMFMVWLALYTWMVFTNEANELDTIIVMYAMMYSGFMVCHGELIKAKPHHRHLTHFYLMIALGGMLGGIFVNFISMVIFNEWWDLYTPLIIVGGICIFLLLLNSQKTKNYWTLGTTGLGVLILPCFVIVLFMSIFGINSEIYRHRNIYGLITILEYLEVESKQLVRQLNHGAIVHGLQFQDEKKSHIGNTYYSPISGIAAAIKYLHETKDDISVAAIGLGTGTIATYLKPNDSIHFYEIDQDIIEISQQYFSFLKDTPAQVHISLGDGRLGLEAISKQSDQKFDLIVVDAFSGDAIPFHLITVEAFEIYKQLLNPNGIVAFHISNSFIDLTPITKGLAQANDMGLYRVNNVEVAPRAAFSAHWSLITQAQLQPWLDQHANRFRSLPSDNIQAVLWYDDNNSLLPHIRLIVD